MRLLTCLFLTLASPFVCEAYFEEEDNARVAAAFRRYHPAVEWGRAGYCVDYENITWDHDYPSWSNAELWFIPHENILSMPGKQIASQLHNKPLLCNIIKHPTCKNWHPCDVAYLSTAERDVLFLMIHDYTRRALWHLHEADVIIDQLKNDKTRKAAKAVLAGVVSQVGASLCGQPPQGAVAGLVVTLWTGLGEVLVDLPGDLYKIKEHTREASRHLYFADKLQNRLFSGVRPRTIYSGKNY